MGTIPFYWRDIEPEQGKTRYTVDSPRIYRCPAPDKCIDYCAKNGVEPKLHCLNYVQHTPDWAKNTTIAEYKALLEKRFRQISERYADKIPMIEVTNETYMGDCFHPFYYADDFCDWSFREAQKYFPTNELIVNEAFIQWQHPYALTNRNPYYQQIEKLLADNVPVHGVGLQFHHFVRREDEISNRARTYCLYDPRFLAGVMDKLAELNLPLQITEMTVPAYDWTEENEAIQAELLRQMYRLFFAQRGMEAIIYWNVPDGYAAWAPQGDMTAGENYYHGGLLRFDMSEKPTYKVLQQLIREEWMTNAQLTTDAEGYVNLRGFHGEYALTVHADERTDTQPLHLSKDSPRDMTIQLPF